MSNRTPKEALREIRNRIVYMYGNIDGTFNPPALKEVCEIADDAISSPITEKSSAVGNAAALREALETIHDKVNRLDEECGVDPVEIRDIARAALSAPARNCDMYATYAEAAEAHKEYATAYIMRASNKFDFPMEFDEWLFAPAAERKGDGDGR